MTNAANSLQAARTFLLGLILELAESWGLNRVIFCAAAKRGFNALVDRIKENVIL